MKPRIVVIRKEYIVIFIVILITLLVSGYAYNKIFLKELNTFETFHQAMNIL